MALDKPLKVIHSRTPLRLNDVGGHGLAEHHAGNRKCIRQRDYKEQYRHQRGAAVFREQVEKAQAIRHYGE